VVPPYFTRPLRFLPDTCVGFVINSSTYWSVRYRCLFLACLGSGQIQTDIQVSIDPLRG